ncbi:MAG: rhomboid family intramembrane serine protease [Planctomycetaceae bacterium]|nr:rhomboid family intramembrane serine protease [Planctomycetaceae bacterium]
MWGLRSPLKVTLHSPNLWKRMFLLPINTDAPVYHFPWATVTLIVTNILVFVATAFGIIPADPFVLTYGEGLHPLQWMTSMFIHGGVLHLLGNIFFLWGFGLVVEGKIGWKKFLAVYLGLGIMTCGVEQVCLSNIHGTSLGSSAAIFGVMAIALLWAPRNEIILLYFVPIVTLMQIGTIELTILAFSSLLLGFEVLTMFLFGFHLGAAVLHLVGGLLGVGLGLTMLRQGFVDCEGWDLISVMAGKTPESVDPYRYCDPAHSKALRDAAQPSSQTGHTGKRRIPTAKLAHAVRNPEGRIRDLLEQGKPRAALKTLNDRRHLAPDFELPRSELHDLTQGLLRAGMWQDAVPLLVEYVNRFDDAISVRIQTAGILLRQLRRPVAALRMLEPLDPQRLASPLREDCQEVSTFAHELIDSGVIELSGHPV